MGWWLYIYKESDDIRLISVELCGGGKSTTGIAPSVQWRRVRVSQIIKKIAHHISILAKIWGIWSFILLRAHFLTKPARC